MLVKGYHGTTLEVAERLVGGEAFELSEGGGHWLGSGVYFYEGGPGRSLQWLRQNKFKGTDVPLAVVSADIDLSEALDLLDLWGFETLKRLSVEFDRQGFETTQDGLEVAGGRAKPPAPGVSLAMNLRDRALIDWTVERMALAGMDVTAVRGAFLWGRAAFKESFLFDWSHVQIAVRDQTCISNRELMSPAELIPAGT